MEEFQINKTFYSKKNRINKCNLFFFSTSSQINVVHLDYKW